MKKFLPLFALPFTQHFHCGARYEAGAYARSQHKERSKQPDGQEADTKTLFNDENTDEGVASDDDDSMDGGSDNEGEDMNDDDGGDAPGDENTGDDAAADDDGGDDGGGAEGE